MAIIIDRNTKTTRTAAPMQPAVRIAPFPVYPSETPGTPYIPSTNEPSWWDGVPTVPDGWKSAGVQDADYAKFYKEAEAAFAANKTVVFEKDDNFKGHVYSNKTYAGVDMEVSISLPGQADYLFADLNTLSVSTHRESFPVRTLGMVNPMGFTSGPRTIAGSMIFSVIDAYVFYKAARELYGKSAESLWDNTSASVYPLADSLPPFDITITFNNEYEPQGAALRIFGVKIIDDSMTMSIDDLVTENTYSFMAQGIAPVHRAKNWKRVNITDKAPK